MSQVDDGMHGIVVGYSNSIDQRVNFLHHFKGSYSLLDQLLARAFYIDKFESMRIDMSQIPRLQFLYRPPSLIVSSGLMFLREHQGVARRLSVSFHDGKILFGLLTW
jgi:hypothetical protein